MATSPEIFLLSSIVVNGDFQTALAHGIGSELFHSCPDEFAWLERYWKKYKRTPSRAAFKRAFPEFRLKEVDDTAHFVDEVKKSHTQALLTEQMRAQADLIAEGKVSEAAELALRGITKISSGINGVDEVNILTDWQPTFHEVRARKARFEEFGMAGIPTGFDTLDERTGGSQPGQLWLVGGRLGEGKSFACLNMAVAAVLNNKKVHFAALEMTRHEVTMRVHNLLSGHSGKSIFKATALAQGRDTNLADYKKFLEELSAAMKDKSRFTVSDAKSLGSMEIASQLERHNPDVYFLDYLTLAKMRGDGGWQDIAAFSKDLKNLAGEYNVSMIAATQLNRTGADSGKEPPGAETISQSDGPGQDADAVITLKKRSDHITMFKLAKYRHGAAGYCWYSHINLDHGVFEEVSKNRAQEIIDQDADQRDKDLERERRPAKKKALPSVKIRSEQQEGIDQPVRKLRKAR